MTRVLVSTTDGVGTKLRLAIDTGRHDTIGIDLVAMCVNDLVVQGAEPLFFLDYFATGALDVDTAAEVVSGIAKGCAEAGCALVGGETAEMPGMYGDGDYDLAGFASARSSATVSSPARPWPRATSCSASNPRACIPTATRWCAASSPTPGLEWDAPAPFAPDASLGAALLAPTRIYVKALLAALRPGGIKALAHITGGGLVENIPRVLPDGLRAELDARAWDLPAVFRWLQREGEIAPMELARTFNCGIGMVVVVTPSEIDRVSTALAAAGEQVRPIGRIVPAEGGSRDSVIVGTATAWRD